MFGLDFSQGKVAGDIMCFSKVTPYKVYYVLDPDLAGYDLCLLASCNHSIHTYGTFGAWGSLLAGGDVIVPTGNNPRGETEVGYKMQV